MFHTGCVLGGSAWGGTKVVFTQLAEGDNSKKGMSLRLPSQKGQGWLLPGPILMFKLLWNQSMSPNIRCTTAKLPSCTILPPACIAPKDPGDQEAPAKSVS
eukprot:9082003-Alexandrium_andersonii.AAC.1